VADFQRVSKILTAAESAHIHSLAIEYQLGNVRFGGIATLNCKDHLTMVRLQLRGGNVPKVGVSRLWNHNFVPVHDDADVFCKTTGNSAVGALNEAAMVRIIRRYRLS